MAKRSILVFFLLCWMARLSVARASPNNAGSAGRANAAPIVIRIFPDLQQARERGFRELAGRPPFTVHFSARASGGDGALRYSWDFDGDGKADSRARDPRPFTYTRPGEYTAVLTVRDRIGHAAERRQRIVVFKNPESPRWKFGVCDHFNWQPNFYGGMKDVERACGKMKECGVQTVRMDFSWDDIQPAESTYHWTMYDSLVAITENSGIQILPILDYSARWASTARDSSWMVSSPIPNEYAWFAYQAAQRYRRHVHAWEIWNEPNLRRFWMPTPDPVAYANLLKQAYLAIKFADPNAVVILGGLVPCCVDTFHIPITRFLPAIYDNGGKDFFDALGLHPYTHPKEGVVKLLQRLDDTHSVMCEHGDSAKSIWVTEIGVASTVKNEVSDSAQADWLCKSFDALFALRYVSVVFWYDFRNLSDGPEDQNMGIIRNDWSIKPAFKTYQQYISDLR